MAKVLIATPALDCRVHTNYASSLVSLVEYCTRAHMGFDTIFLGHESVIQKARNDILHYALNAGNYTHLLMIDSDMGWEWDALEKLLDADCSVISAMCPKKKYPLEYVFNPIQGESPNNKGVLRVSHASTAFMLIRLEDLALPSLDIPSYKTVNSITGKQAETENFFSAGPIDDWFHGEDVSFTRLLERLNIPVHIHTKVKTNHSGNHVFREENEQTYLRRHQNL